MIPFDGLVDPSMRSVQPTVPRLRRVVDRPDAYDLRAKPPHLKGKLDMPRLLKTPLPIDLSGERRVRGISCPHFGD